jgi:sugar lactone lactonase YvrE
MADDKVFFNGKAATVTAASTTQITVTVPTGAGTGNVTASINGGAPVSGPVFTYQYTYTLVLVAGHNPENGVVNGTGAAAFLDSPSGIAIDNAGNIYLPETHSQLIRKITPQGVVSSYAGSSSLYPTSNGTVSTVTLYYPEAVAVDASGNLYIADGSRMWIQKITPTGVATVLAGSGGIGADNGIGSKATFNFPSGLAVDASGNVYVTDSGNNLIRKITPEGLVTTFAGNGNKNSVDGTGTSASFNSPFAIATDSNGNVYVTDNGSYKIRKITPGGVVSTLCSNAFGDCTGIALDNSRNVYITNLSGSNGEIDKITPDGTESRLAQELPLYSAGIVLDKNSNIYFVEGNDVYQLAYQ